MTDAKFWSLIDTSRARARGKSRRQEHILRRLLGDLSADDMAEFKIRYDNLIRKAYRSDLWAAAFLIGEGCSCDGFWDFRSWLVSQGKKVYQAALKDPESLLEVVRRKDRRRDRRFLDYAPFIWEEKTGRPMSECPCLGSNLGEDPEGEEWDEEDLPQKFPRLWKEFGWKRRAKRSR
jgi:hypothetical protein